MEESTRGDITVGELNSTAVLNTTSVLSDAQLSQLQQEKQRLQERCKQLQLDIKALRTEQLRRDGGAPNVDVSGPERLLEACRQVTGTRLARADVRLILAEDGVSVSQWTVQMIGESEDLEITVSYVTRRDQTSPSVPIETEDVKVLSYSAVLAPLVAAHGTNLQRLLHGLYDYCHLVAAWRSFVASELADREVTEVEDGAATEVALPELGDVTLTWRLDFDPVRGRYEHQFRIVGTDGVTRKPPPSLNVQIMQDGLADTMKKLLSGLNDE